jgi:hypothetical protein
MNPIVLVQLVTIVDLNCNNIDSSVTLGRNLRAVWCSNSVGREALFAVCASGKNLMFA